MSSPTGCPIERPQTTNKNTATNNGSVPLSAHGNEQGVCPSIRTHEQAHEQGACPSICMSLYLQRRTPNSERSAANLQLTSVRGLRGPSGRRFHCAKKPRPTAWAQEARPLGPHEPSAHAGKARGSVPLLGTRWSQSTTSLNKGSVPLSPHSLSRTLYPRNTNKGPVPLFVFG